MQEHAGRLKAVCVTVEQEIFTAGKNRKFGAQAIRMHEIFSNFWLAEVLSFKMTPCLLKPNGRVGPLVCSGNIHEQEIFANLPIFAKFAKISCTRKFVVLQYVIIAILSKW